MALSPAVAVAPSPADDVIVDVSIRYRHDSAVVVVRGELDAFSTPDLRMVLDGVVGRGHRTVVLDLAGVTLLGAAGVGAIAVATAGALAAGGGLTVRSPSLQSRRVLDACDMAALIDDDSQPGRADVVAPLPLLVPVVAALVATAGANTVVDAVLGAFTALAREAVFGADGASVTLARNGQMTTVGASDETIAQMDRDQYATGEGPCLAAAAEGERFHIVSIAEEARWPTFVGRAREDGIASILSTPLLVEGRSVGALNIYSNTDRAFGEGDEVLASLFADHASAVLAHTAFAMSDAQLAERLRGALDGRQVIALAQGVLMARSGISAERAHALLRHAARRDEITVRERALEVLRPLAAHPAHAEDLP